MRRLQIILIALAALWILFLMFGKGLPTAYSGVYGYERNANVQLELFRDNRFELHDTLGKFDTVQKGHYTVKNDELHLIVQWDNDTQEVGKTLDGHIDGSDLRLEGYEGLFHKLP